ncbi:MAG: hypothetical protein U0441_02505 [Polyangiaceae bacterium]
MSGYDAREVTSCYDLAAREYAASFLGELEKKPFDRNLLDRFSEMVPAGEALIDFAAPT